MSEIDIFHTVRHYECRCPSAKERVEFKMFKEFASQDPGSSIITKMPPPCTDPSFQKGLSLYDRAAPSSMSSLFWLAETELGKPKSILCKEVSEPPTPKDEEVDGEVHRVIVSTIENTIVGGAKLVRTLVDLIKEGDLGHKTLSEWREWFIKIAASSNLPDGLRIAAAQSIDIFPPDK